MCIKKFVINTVYETIFLICIIFFHKKYPFEQVNNFKGITKNKKKNLKIKKQRRTQKSDDEGIAKHSPKRKQKVSEVIFNKIFLISNNFFC